MHKSTKYTRIYEAMTYLSPSYYPSIFSPLYVLGAPPGVTNCLKNK